MIWDAAWAAAMTAPLAALATWAPMPTAVRVVAWAAIVVLDLVVVGHIFLWSAERWLRKASSRRSATLDGCPPNPKAASSPPSKTTSDAAADKP